MIKVLIATHPSLKKLLLASEIISIDQNDAHTDDDKKPYFLIHSVGHAFIPPSANTSNKSAHKSSPNQERYHALCAALSTVEYSFLYSIKMLTNARVETILQKDEGIFKLTIHQDVNDKNQSLVLTTLLQSFIISLQMIAKTHKKDFLLQIK